MKRLAAILAALLSLLVVLGVGASPASAHAALLSTSPGDAEILESGPAEIVLNFGEAVSTGLGGVRVLTAEGDRVDEGNVTRTDGGTKVHAPVKPGLAEGTYVVVWRVVSADSHPISGSFTFAVGAASVDEKELLGRGNLTSLTEAPRGPGIALGVSRFVGFSALTVFLGAALFLLILWREGAPVLRRLLLFAAITEAAAAAAALLLQGPYAAGLSLTSTFDFSLTREVLHSQYGEATAARLGLAMLVIALHRSRPAVLVGLGLGWAATWAMAGHAGAGKWQPTAAVMDVAHLAATAAWVGGLVVLIAGLRHHWWPDDAVLPRWSRYATWSVVILVVTGSFASLRQVGELGAVFSTDYGKRLVIKLALVGVMLLLALVGRTYVQAHFAVGVPEGPPPAESRDGLRRSVGIEAGLAAVVLAVTALLVNTTPAEAAFAPPYTGTSVAGPLTVAVDIYPARKGLNGLHIYTVGKGGRTVDVAEVSGELFRADGDRISISPTRKSLGHYEDLNLALPAKGTWTISLQIRVNDLDSYATTQTFTVR